MKKLFSFLLMILLCFNLLTVSVVAAELPLIIDNAGLLTDPEQENLQTLASDLRQTYGMDVVILTESSIGGVPAYQYADDYYDQKGYGDNGILFLLAMEEREWYVSTCGDARYAIMDDSLEDLETALLPFLSEGAYYDGFSQFLLEVSAYLNAYAQGVPIDGYDISVAGDHHEDVIYHAGEAEPSFLLSLVLGLIAAAISLAVMRFSMNTKRAQHAAGDYMVQGSYHLHNHQDIFLYSSLSKTRRQQNTNSVGGSSVHRSSGGRSHGGRGGKF